MMDMSIFLAKFPISYLKIKSTSITPIPIMIDARIPGLNIPFVTVNRDFIFTTFQKVII